MQGQKGHRLRVTTPKLLVLGPEILLNSLNGQWRVTGTVPIMAEPPRSTSIPRLLPTKANMGSGGNRCLWEKHKWEIELHSQLIVPHRGGEQGRGKLGRKQRAGGKTAGMTNAWDKRGAATPGPSSWRSPHQNQRNSSCKGPASAPAIQHFTAVCTAERVQERRTLRCVLIK